MYVIDITRLDHYNTNDILLANNSINAKSKILDYIDNYARANCNVIIDKDLLDQNLNIDHFSLSKFMADVYSLNIDKDLIINSYVTDKDHSLFVKYYDDNIDNPYFYILNKGEEKKASAILKFLINDFWINKYQNNLEIYESKKLTNEENIISHHSRDCNCDIIPLYSFENGIYIDEMLNSNMSLSQLADEKVGIYL